MGRKNIVIVGVVAALACCWPVHAESASVMLEKGIFAEQTKGDLDEAIKIYQELLADAEANRPFIARARYRLGVCYQKKNQPAEATAQFEKLIAEFPENKELCKQARERIAEARSKTPPEQVAKIVKQSVMTISTCAETDPRLPKAMAAVRGLDERTVVSELTKHLASDMNTVRRAAIYMLWKGEMKDIGEAAGVLQKLCDHKESLTRGMAALALGGRKVDASFQRLCEMTLKDKDRYARLCAALALGQTGRPEAKDVLEKALKDPDALVRSNAESALTMLAEAQAARPAEPQILQTTPAALTNDVDPSLNEMTVTFDRAMTDKSWSWTGSGETFPKMTGQIHYDQSKKTCTLPVKLEPGKMYLVGINGPSHKAFRSADRVPARPYLILFATRAADGKPTPLPQALVDHAKQVNARPVSGFTEADRKAAMDAAEKWLALVDAGKYGECCEGAADWFKALVPRRKLQVSLKQARMPLGQLRSRTLAVSEFQTSLPGAPEGEYVVIQFLSAFENKTNAVETVTPMKDKDGQWRVSGYYIK